MSGPVSFGLFGTLVTVDPPVDRPRQEDSRAAPEGVAEDDGRSGRALDRTSADDWRPASVVAEELAARGVEVPEDWATAYAEQHLDPPPLAAVPIPAHVAAALRSRGVGFTDNAVRRAVVAAFDPAVTPRPGAVDAVEAAAERGPVGVLTDAVVPELAGRTLLRAGLRESVDTTVTAAACGWYKPHEGAFEAVARRLGCDPADLIHVGGRAVDAGVRDVGGRFVDTRETPLGTLAERFPDGG